MEGIQLPALPLPASSIHAMAGHAVAWSLLSVMVACVAGLTTGRLKSAIIGLLAGVAAGILASLLFQLLATLIKPLSNPERAIPSGDPIALTKPLHLVRILWISLWAVITGLALGRMLHFRPAETQSPATPPQPQAAVS